MDCGDKWTAKKIQAFPGKLRTPGSMYQLSWKLQKLSVSLLPSAVIGCQNSREHCYKILTCTGG